MLYAELVRPVACALLTHYRSVDGDDHCYQRSRLDVPDIAQCLTFPSRKRTHLILLGCLGLCSRFFPAAWIDNSTCCRTSTTPRHPTINRSGNLCHAFDSFRSVCGRLFRSIWHLYRKRGQSNARITRLTSIAGCGSDTPTRSGKCLDLLE
jgi:hypothetical protein